MSVTIKGSSTTREAEVDAQGNLYVTLANSPPPADRTVETVISGTEQPSISLDGSGTIRVDITGIWTGVLNFESSDDGVNYIPLKLLPFGQIENTGISQSAVAATTQTGSWLAASAGLRSFRIRGGVTSGRASCVMQASQTVAVVDAFLHVDGFVDPLNSTVVPLAANAIFTGQSTDMLPFTSVRISLFTDVASAPNGLKLQWSSDGVNWDMEQHTNVPAMLPAQGIHAPFGRLARFFRVIYQNGPNAQTVFRMQCVQQRSTEQTAHSFMNVPLLDSDSGVHSKSILFGKTPDGNFSPAVVSLEGVLSTGGLSRRRNFLFSALNQQQVIDLQGIGGLSVTVGGPFVGTLFAETSIDGVLWTPAPLLASDGSGVGTPPFTSTLTAAAAAAARNSYFFIFGGALNAFRLTCNSYTSGSAQVHVEATNIPFLTNVANVFPATFFNVLASQGPSLAVGTSPWIVSQAPGSAVDVTDRAGRVLGHVVIDAVASPANLNAFVPDVTDRANRQLGHVIIDNGVVIANFPVPDVVDRPGRLLGHVIVDSIPPAPAAVSPATVSVSNFPTTQHVIIDTLPQIVFASPDVTDRPSRQLGHVTVDALPFVSVANFPSPMTVQMTSPMTISGHVIVDALPPIISTDDMIDRASRLVGHVTVDNFPLPTSPLTVSVSNFPTSIAVNNFPPFPAVQPVSGTVSIASPATDMTVHGTVDVQDRGARQLGHVVVDSMPVASSPATVNVTNFPSPATDVTIHGLVDMQDRVARQLGHVLVDNFPNTVSPATVSVANLPAVQPVSGTVSLASPSVIIGTVSVTGQVTIADTPQVNVTDRPARALGHVIVDSMPGLSLSSPTTIVGNVGLVPDTIVTFASPAIVGGDVTVHGTIDVQDRIARQLGNVAVNNQPPAQVNARTFVCITLDEVSGITTEALDTMNINRGFVVTTGTGYRVTAGKTLRLQSIVVTVRGTTNTDIFGKVRVRGVASGSVAAGSPLLITMAIAATANNVGTSGIEEMEFPGGLDIPSGAQIGISHLESSTSSVVSVTLIGYEY